MLHAKRGSGTAERETHGAQSTCDARLSTARKVGPYSNGPYSIGPYTLVLMSKTSRCCCFHFFFMFYEVSQIASCGIMKFVTNNTANLMNIFTNTDVFTVL